MTAEIMRLYVVEGMSSNAIAARAGISGRTILHRLHAAGVEIRPLRLPRPLCARCKKREVKTPGATYCDNACRRLYPRPEPRICALDGCEIVFTPPTSNRNQRFCSSEHWYRSPEAAERTPPSNGSPRKSLAERVRTGTFIAHEHEQRLQEDTLDETCPDVLRELQRLFREAAGGTERRALAQCFGRIVRASGNRAAS
jgi:hypothetical protein